MPASSLSSGSRRAAAPPVPPAQPALRRSARARTWRHARRLLQQTDTLRLDPANAGKGFGELQALLVKDGLAAKYVDTLYPGTLSNEEVRRPSCRH